MRKGLKNAPYVHIQIYSFMSEALQEAVWLMNVWIFDDNEPSNVIKIINFFASLLLPMKFVFVFRLHFYDFVSHPSITPTTFTCSDGKGLKCNKKTKNIFNWIFFRGLKTFTRELFIRIGSNKIICKVP